MRYAYLYLLDPVASKGDIILFNQGSQVDTELNKEDYIIFYEKAVPYCIYVTKPYSLKYLKMQMLLGEIS